ncbi:PD-(D/E)XK motif protein [Polynucleobacter sp. es-EL-1]|uniref:PD-(D/E)XK motif protein n=1 Tax=Polynucleobacter sp. es-EL-1 TaxID=1855652 RepID=UPI001BFDE6CD|nr:PD-(D/E)XK motif protein [Polynucleobacter sp. es-EL-1]QWE11178.1 PD-(D/E)XK motif protein [Polynucleobacter sp. es-EL-1]
MLIWEGLTTPEKGTFSLRMEHQASYGNWSWLKTADSGVGIVLEFHGGVDISNIASTKYFEVEVKNVPHIGNLLTIVCRDAEFFGIFEVLCRDLIVAAISAQDLPEAVRLIGDRIAAWTKLFARGYKGLRKNEVYGLAAELSFLKKWLSADFLERVDGWSASKGSSQDFISNNKGKAVEIKARSTSQNVVKISSLEQLDSGTPLFLGVYPVAQIKEGEFFETLDSLVCDVANNLGQQDLLMFNQLLLLAGYIKGEYEGYRMKIGLPEFYEISAGFPRVIRSSIPSEIISCRYELNLDKCSNYKIKEGELVELWMS